MCPLKASFVCAALALCVFSSIGFAADDGKVDRVVPTDAAPAADVDLDARQAARADPVSLVFLCTTKDREGTWDLGDKGVEHVRSGKTCWVAELQPNGTSPNYYWAKEKIASGVWYWAFKKEAGSDGKHDIIYSLDDQTYYIWGTGAKLTRVKL